MIGCLMAVIILPILGWRWQWRILYEKDIVSFNFINLLGVILNVFMTSNEILKIFCGRPFFFQTTYRVNNFQKYDETANFDRSFICWLTGFESLHDCCCWYQKTHQKLVLHDSFQKHRPDRFRVSALPPRLSLPSDYARYHLLEYHIYCNLV